MTPNQEKYLCDLIRKKLEPGANNPTALLLALNAWAGTRFQGLPSVTAAQARGLIDQLKALPDRSQPTPF